MKKLFTSCLGLFVALAMQAQNEFPLHFADKDGNVIADGSVLDLTEAEDDGFGGILMPTGLYVKNTSGSAVRCAGSFSITSMSNGAFQSCFPSNCMQANAVGEYATQESELAAGALKSMQTEWLPAAAGACSVVYQLVTYKQNVITQKWTKDQEGPAVTLNFTYGTSALKSLKELQSVTYYDIQGRPVGQPGRGVFIQKTTFTDGSSIVRKIKKQ